MGVAYRVLSPELTVGELQAIRNDPNRRLTASPLGMKPEELEKNGPRVYISEAVPWKGKKGDDFVDEATGAHGALLNANILARKISEAYSGVTGTTIDPKTGKIVPKKGVAQRRWREEHPELVKEYNTHVKPSIKPKKGKLPKLYH